MKKKVVTKPIATCIIITLLLAFLQVPQVVVKGYVGTLGNVIATSVSENTVTLTIDNQREPNDDILEIQVCDQNIIRFNYRPNGITASADTPMLDPNKTWDTIGATITTNTDPIIISTNEGTVEITKSPCRVTIKNEAGTKLLWETTNGGVFYDGIRFLHNKNDNIYGIRGYDFTEGNGDILRNNSTHAAHAGQQGDAGGPFIWSTSGYGVFVDSDGGYPYTNSSTGKLEFYYGGTPTEGRRYTKKDVEYFIMLGNPEEIMGAYAKITGATPMMPKWSLGFSNFEWNSTQEEMTNAIDTYRAKNIPIDSIGLDYDWKNYGQTNYGEFTWNTHNFPSAVDTSLKNLMDSKGIHMIGITKPRIVTKDASGSRTSQYWDAQNNGYWYPNHYEYKDYFIPVNVRSIDPYNSDARNWYWEHSKDAFDKGIVGWWNDETDKVSSGAAQYWFGNFTTLHLSQAIFEGQKEYATNRVWQTARTYYPGTQRYGTTLWSGDIGIQYYKGQEIDWTVGMKEQRATMLSAINLGQSKWGMDIGGFNQADGTTKNPEPELYSKWVAFGSTVPVFRVHGNNHQQRQPWYYGNTAEELAKYAIQLRYSLLPYMYTYERSAYDTGVGLVRPLIFYWPSDQKVKNYTDAWMFGDYILSSPVVDKNQTNKKIYLPLGTWIDYHTGRTYTGGNTINYSLDANTWKNMPLFIKEGAIIPTYSVQNHVAENSINEVFVDVFPSNQKTSFTYYDDHGDNYDYEGSDYVKQILSATKTGANVTIEVEGKTGNYTPNAYSYIFKVHKKAASNVTLGGSNLTQVNNLNEVKQSATECFAVGKDVYGEVTYIKVIGGSDTLKELVASGTQSVAINSVQYEAEEASLSGNTLQTMASVATNHGNYEGKGFVEGLKNHGAAVTFYPKVTVDGDYNVKIRYANATGSDKTISVYVNGERVEQVTLPSLASWDIWSDMEATIPLTSGNNSVKLMYNSDAGDTGNVNIDYIKLPLVPEIAKYEAESAILRGGAGINTNHYYYTGVGFVDGYGTTGANTEFQIYAPTSGTYNVEVRYANGNRSTKTLSVYLNGADVKTVSFSSPSGNWNDWTKTTFAVSLQQGINTLSLKKDGADSGKINIDRILVDMDSITNVTSEKNLIDNGSFERKNHLSDWTEWHPWGQSLAFGVDSGSGSNPPESAYIGNQRAYFWAGHGYKQSIHQDRNIANGTYRFEAMVKMKYTNPYTARAEVSGYGGAQKNINITNDGNWHYISQDITVTSGKIDVGFYVDSSGGTLLLIDDVRLTKID